MEKLLAYIHPALASLDGAPLWVFLIVAALTIAFIVGSRWAEL